MAFLPVAVPGGQGKQPVFVDPEEVIAVFSNNVDNTSTSIVFRNQEYILQVKANLKEVLKALQCGPRVEDCKHRR